MGSSPTGSIMNTFTCVESTIDISYGIRTVRLWVNRDLKDIPENPELLFYEQVVKIKEKLKNYLPHNELLSWLSTLPKVNAVQLIEHYSGVDYGTVVYTVPFEDVHG